MSEVKVREQKCSACGRWAVCMVGGLPFCNRHYQLMRKYGEPVARPRKRTSSYTVRGDVLEVVTSKGDVILADAADKELIERYSWCVSKTGYAVANIRGKVTKMHRYILGDEIGPEDEVDHRNRDTLDNRRKNLRVCTRAENARNIGTKKSNRLGHLGIRRTPAGTYNARIVVNRKEIHLGNFGSLEEAIAARNKAEDTYHKEFASHRAGDVAPEVQNE